MPVRQKKMDSSGSCEKSARSITELEKSGLKMTRRRVKMSSGWKGGDPKNFRANLRPLLGPFIKDVINRGKLGGFPFDNFS